MDGNVWSAVHGLQAAISLCFRLLQCRVTLISRTLSDVSSESQPGKKRDVTIVVVVERSYAQDTVQKDGQPVRQSDRRKEIRLSERGEKSGTE